MKKWMAALGLAMMLAQPAAGWRPDGWVYAQYPWAYDSATSDWMWFNPDTQYIHHMTAGTWSLLPASGIATGWVFYQWPYAFAQGNNAWHWINPDVQWVVNMRTAAWSRFGVDSSGMVLVPGGTNAGADPDGGAYSLNVDSFSMDRNEVTKELWDEVRAWGLNNGYTDLPAGGGKGPTHPVHSVSWPDVLKWCNARSQREGRLPTYRVNGTSQIYTEGDLPLVGIHTFDLGVNFGYRLPTVEQWRYAAMGGVSSRRFPWGDSDLIQHARANYWSSATDAYDTSLTRGYHPAFNDGVAPYTSPTGWFLANGYGLFDMAGNVSEWCWDASGGNRYAMGGNFGSSASSARIHSYGLFSVFHSGDSVGFRTVIPGSP